MDAVSQLKQDRKKAAKPLLWIGIVSIIMLFAGLTSAYVVSRGGSNWVIFELPKVFFYSTATILISSISINYALQAAKKNNLKGVTQGVVLTLILGVVFAYFQFQGWGALIENNIFLVDKTNVSGSYIYVLTAMHLAHMAGGFVALFIALYKSLKGKYNSTNTLGLELCAIYWHFLDILWIYLFLFLLFIR